MAVRDEKNQQEHDTLLEMISRKIKIPTWTLATNPGQQQNAGVPYPTAAGRALAYPDIVAHEKFTKKLAAVGEVETAESVTAEEAEAEWTLFSQLAPRFFLYVPAEMAPEAKDLLRRRRIRPEGLFLYRFTERNMFVVERAKGGS
jgi:hypothetical protein